MAPKATPSPRVPSFRLHKATGQGFVEIDGARRYLGRYDLPQTKQAYHRLIAEWLANGRRLPVAPEDITVIELVDRYLDHAQNYYRLPNGEPGPGIENVRVAIRPLLELYGPTPAAEFGPLKLITIREQWVTAGLRRVTCNGYVGTLKRVFKFGVARELIPATVHTALEAVEGLRKGRCAAKESRIITSVPQTHIDAVKPFVSRQVWGLIQLQLLTGARSGEVVSLRRIDLDTSGAIWTAKIEHHKTSHRGKDRTLYFGKRAQVVLREFFPGKGPMDYLFSPEDAERERLERRHAERTTPLSCGNRPGTNKLDAPEVAPGAFYTNDSYRRAIERATAAAIKEAQEKGLPEIAPWHPHRLRHTAATRIRKELGLEAAQVWLGHATADVTQIYAEVDTARALDIAARMG